MSARFTGVLTRARGVRSSLLLLSLSMAVSACRERALEAEISGCAAITAAGACELPASRQIRAYLADGSDDAIAAIDGRTITSSIAHAQPGVRLELEIPAGARTLRIRDRDRNFTLALQEPESAPQLESIAAMRAAGELDRADAALIAARADLPDRMQPRALREAARNARTRGDPRAAELYLESAELFARSARHCEAAESTLAAAFSAIRLGRRFAVAQSALDHHDRALAALDARTACADQRARGHYYRALYALEVGELDGAARRFLEAERSAQRLGLEVDVTNARQGRALALERLGRYEEAFELLAAAEDRSDTADCASVRASINLGWIALIMRESGAGGGRDPRPHLERAHARLDAPGCGDAAVRANVEVNLALEAVQRGAIDEAATWIDRAETRTSTPDVQLELWIADLRGRIALERGHVDDAERAYARLAVLAEESASPEASWRAAIGAAAVLERRGDPVRAAEAYARAEALLDREAALVELFGGRERFLVGRERGTRAQVALLIDHGRAREAAQVARRARTRLLAPLFHALRLGRMSEVDRERRLRAMTAYQVAREALEALDAARWKVAEENRPAWIERRRAARAEVERALNHGLSLFGAEPSPDPPRPAGELTLAYFPLPRGWAGLAELDGSVIAKRLPGAITATASAERLTEVLLAPFAAELSRAKRVRILSYGSVRSIDVHLLPWRGAPLMSALPAAYGIDRPATAISSPAERRALVVADPRGDLSAAAREGRDTAKILELSFGSVDLLHGRDADRVAVSKALPQSDHFHFAGHGEPSAEEAWEHALLLAGGERLTAADVLALPRAPRRAVLSACRSASARPLAALETIGLAQAFVVAGAEEVLAAAHAVEDQDQAEAMAAIYRHLDLDGDWALARALSAAAKEQPRAAAALRVLVP